MDLLAGGAEARFAYGCPFARRSVVVDISQAAGTREGIGPDGCQRVRKLKGLHVAAVLEAFRADGGHAMVDDNALDHAAVVVPRFRGEAAQRRAVVVGSGDRDTVAHSAAAKDAQRAVAVQRPLHVVRVHHSLGTGRGTGRC